ncbi:MAG: hypothetical protein Q8O67_30365 [Deltaproteobacteria bacterium]|nr:hypothetical protein [Deltaproteobacteria bacterium]
MSTRGGLLLWMAGAALSATGCLTVTVYEPQRGLQRPVVVDAAAQNFAGTSVEMRCLTSEDLPPGDAERVCSRLCLALQIQGAECQSTVPRDAEGGGLAFDGKGADLTIEIESKSEHEDDYPALVLISALTFTLIPTIEEQTFSQHIVVRGRDRSVLLADGFRARFINYTGIAVWGINWLLDVFIRPDNQDMTGDAPNKDFSRDFYQQVSQLAFNARVRSDLLGLTRSPRRAAAPIPIAAPPPPTTTTTTPPAAATTTTPEPIPEVSTPLPPVLLPPPPPPPTTTPPGDPSEGPPGLLDP